MEFFEADYYLYPVCVILGKHGANVNAKSDGGLNPLYEAASGGSADEVKFLLNQGVNPSIVTDYDWAPLHWAAHNGHLEFVCLLLQFGAAVNPVSDQRKTPLDMVIDRKDRRDIEKRLHDAGAERAPISFGL